MTTEKAIELLHRLQDEQFDGIHGDERREALSMAVRALFSQQTVNDSQELVNDCISRQGAIDALDKHIDTFDAIDTNYLCGLRTAMSFLKEMPSAQPQWTPCSERLPEEPYGCLVTVWDTDPITMDEFENILPYFVGWDGKQWNDAEGEQCPFEVIAWMPLPEPYGGESE